MNTTYEIRTDSNGTPFAIEIVNGKIVAAAGIFELTAGEKLPHVLGEAECEIWLSGYRHGKDN